MSDGLSDDVSDWGSDFDDDVDEETVRHQHSEIYEIPDGKPTRPVPTVVPEWLNKVADENDKPSAAEYIENVLLPTRATKDEESKNFIETLKRKLSQKNLLAAVKNSDNKTSNHNNNVTKNSIVAGNNNFNSISPPENVKRAVELGLATQYYDEESLKWEMEKFFVHHAVVDVVKTHAAQDSPQINQIKDALQKYPWFYRVDRSRAELILENYTTDGAFLVRECHHGGGPMVPFTLTIRFNGRLFHIQIRLRSDSRFALGTLKLNEMHFESVAEMIDTYKKTHLQLHSNGKFFGETKLTQPPIVYSYSNKC